MKNLVIVLVCLLTVSISAQKNNFLVNPEEILPLQAGVSEYQTTERWDDVRLVETGSRSNCFPNFDRPLLPSEGDVWDRDIISITKTLPAGAQLSWVDSKNFVIQVGGNDLVFKSDTIQQIYAGLRRLNVAGQVDCQELFPARRFYLAGYSDNSWGIDYNAVTGKMSADIQPWNGKEFEVIVNNLMLIDSVFGSDANKIWLETGLSGLQNGTYRTQISHKGHASQTHYLIKCPAKFEANVKFYVTNSCPGKNNGKIEFTNVTGGSGHYNVVLFNSAGQSIDRGLFDGDNLGLNFPVLEPGNYTFQVQDIFKVAHDAFSFTVTEDETVCECNSLVSQLQAEKKVLQDKVVALEVQVEELKDLKFATITLETTTTSLADVKEMDLEIFPNPTVDFLRFKTSDQGYLKDCLVYIYSAGGSLEQSVKINSEEQIDVSNLPAGTYFIKLSDGTQQKTIRKFIKQ